jgi:hypothetical protein
MVVETNRYACRCNGLLDLQRRPIPVFKCRVLRQFDCVEWQLLTVRSKFKVAAIAAFH